MFVRCRCKEMPGVEIHRQEPIEPIQMSGKIGSELQISVQLSALDSRSDFHRTSALHQVLKLS